MSLLWVPVTLAASGLQTARNAAQAGLTARIGVIGATQARFLYGLPFALCFLALGALLLEPPPSPNAAVLGWTALGAFAQIGATALLLMAMRDGGFAAATALSKTEPALIAVLAALMLGEAPTPLRALAIALAVAGALLLSGKAKRAGALTGVAAGAAFALSAVGFRGAVAAFDGGSPLIRSSTALCLSLALQSAALGAWMAAFDRAALIGGLREWRGSLSAGFFGAAASQFWFLGFALASAAQVRTLALVEAPLALIVSGRIFRERITARAMAGIALIMLGAGLLIWA